MQSPQEVSRFVPQTDIFTSSYEDYTELFHHGHHTFGCCTGHGRVWLVKSVAAAAVAPTALQTRLRKEFEIGLGLSHPGVVRVVEFADIPGAGPSIIMENVHGKPLDEFINENHPSAEELHRIASAIIDTMAYVNSKDIVHLDLKPSNILVTESGYPVRIIDFGLSDSRNFAILKQPGGTPRYAAPEQFNPDYEASPSADVWAIARIFSEFHLPGIPRSVMRLCLQKNPSLRIHSAMALKKSIAACRRRNLTVKRSLWSAMALAAVVAVAFIVSGISTQDSRAAVTVADTAVTLPAVVNSTHASQTPALPQSASAHHEAVVADAPAAKSAVSDKVDDADFIARHDALVNEIDHGAARLIDSITAVFRRDSVPSHERAQRLSAAFSEYMRGANVRMYEFKSNCPASLIDEKPQEWFTIYAPPLNRRHSQVTEMLRTYLGESAR